jgi:hypothetical protein
MGMSSIIPEKTISETALIVAIKEQIFSDLNGEAVILNIKTGTYYGLNEVGTFIWQLIQSPTTIQQIHTALLEAYDVEASVCQQDVYTLLQEFQAVGLIEMTEADIA